MRKLERRWATVGVILVVLAWSCATGTVYGTSLKCVELHPHYQHDRFDTQPKDIIRQFRAYTTSFDSADDDNGDGKPDRLGVPEWVAYEMRRAPAELGPAPDGPSTWITDATLHAEKVAPNHDSYTSSGYSRGHMCMKSHAWRLGANADWNTHIVLNACPQRQKLNNGAWKALENKTGKWADRYEAVWIICGPIIYKNTVTKPIGDPGEVPVAVPDAFFKIVVKDSGVVGQPDVLAFIFPMEGVGQYNSSNCELTPYLTSVDIIEVLSGLDFLTALDDETEAKIEKVVHPQLWPE